MTSYLALIPWSELTFEVSRSQGPGGQNVNKTNSAVQVRWTPATSVAFSDLLREKLLRRLAGKLTVEGELLIRCQTSRDQDQNKKECLRKLDELLARTLSDPKPRRPTKPTRGSQRRRAEGKKQRSEIKEGRSKIRY